MRSSRLLDLGALSILLRSGKICAYPAPMRTLLAAVLLVASTSFAKVVSKPVGYELGATKFEGVLIFDDAVKTPRPGLVLVPNWMGINAANLKQAEELAGQRYVLF